jgi:hypothetical protein
MTVSVRPTWLATTAQPAAMPSNRDWFVALSYSSMHTWTALLFTTTDGSGKCPTWIRSASRLFPHGASESHQRTLAET